MVKKYGLATVLSLAFIGGGFLVLFLAWNGAASVDCTQCQIPYLLSGGATGLGLIGLGAGLLLFESGRRMLRNLEARLEALSEVVRESGSPSSSVSLDDVTPVAHAGNGAVVIGRSSFHRPDCRLVAGKDEMDLASMDDAMARGLNACRVCDPTVEPAGAGRRR